MGRRTWRAWWARCWREAIPIGAGLVILFVGVYVSSWTSHDGKWLLGTGAVLVGLGVFGDRLVKLKAGPIEVEVDREREATARAADIATPEEEVAQRIESDDPGRPTPSEDDADVVGILNYAAGSLALSAVSDLITRQGSPLAGCKVRLFLYDENDERLLPAFESDEDPDSEGWEVGKGATGTAYATGDYVVVKGPAVSDDTYGLTPEQQDRYQDLTAVAATPIYNSDGSAVVGVLTVSTTEAGHQLDTYEGKQDHTMAALLASRILIELFKWFGDD